MKITFLLLTLFFINSCAPTSEVKIRSAIQEAKHFLNSSRCSKAQEILDDVGFQEDNADYVMVYASTYACLAGYNELDDIFGGNLENLDSDNFIKSLASFDTSIETEPDSVSYTNLKLAIDTILFSQTAAGGVPDTATRNEEFGSRKSGDMSMQVLYMLLIQMGKYFALYGNADANGDKGAGSFTNECIYSYTTNDATDWIATGGTGACNSTGSGEGSDFLEAPETAADIKRRLCEGIYYYNNIINVLGNLTLPSSSSTETLDNLEDALDLLITAAQTAEESNGGVPYNDGPVASRDAIANLKVIRDFDDCENQDLGRIEKWHAIFFETIYQ